MKLKSVIQLDDGNELVLFTLVEKIRGKMAEYFGDAVDVGAAMSHACFAAEKAIPRSWIIKNWLLKPLKVRLRRITLVKRPLLPFFVYRFLFVVVICLVCGAVLSAGKIGTKGSLGEKNLLCIAHVQSSNNSSTAYFQSQNLRRTDKHNARQHLSCLYASQGIYSQPATSS